MLKATSLFVLKFIIAVCFATSGLAQTGNYRITVSDERLYIADHSLPLVKVFTKRTGELMDAIKLEKPAIAIEIDAEEEKIFVSDEQHAYYIDLRTSELKNKFAMHNGGMFEHGGLKLKYTDIVKPVHILQNGVMTYVDASGGYVSPGAKTIFYYDILQQKEVPPLTNEALIKIHNNRMKAYNNKYKFINENLTDYSQPPVPESPTYPNRTDYRKNKDYKLALEKYNQDMEHYNNVVLPEWNAIIEAPIVVKMRFTIKTLSDELVCKLEDYTGLKLLNDDLAVAIDGDSYDVVDLSNKCEKLYTIDRF